MKSRSTKVAVAASVVVACVIGLSLWTGTQSGIALADVLARVEQVKTIRFKGTWTMDGQIAAGRPYRMEIPSTSVMSREYGYKIEYIDPNGGSVPGGGFYVSLQKKTHIQIAPEKKKYFRRALDDGYAQRFQKELELNIDPGAFLKNIMACKYESLGRSTIDSVDVEVFRTTDPNCRPPMGLQRFENAQVDVKVWVDVKTRLPVRYEDFSSSLDQRGNTISQRYVQHDFEWDIPVTAADFEPPPVPDGYTVVEGPRDEQTALQGLRQCAELCGNYPDISDFIGLPEAITLAFEKSETPTAKKIRELTEKEQGDRVEGVVMAVKQLTYYYDELFQQKKDPAYYGKTVTPKDTDRVLMRWKLFDNEYRVIFGDLHAETVSLEKLTELEKTPLK